MAEKTYLSIEVLFDYCGECKRFKKENFTQEQLKAFREKVFQIGFLAPIETDRWALIPPWDIRSIQIWKQDKFYKE